jgi:YVTN family beta-propeller protein
LRKAVLSSIIFTAIVLFANTACEAETPPASSEWFAFVTSEADDNLAIIDLKTEKVIKTLPAGKTPHALVFIKNR